MSGEYLNVRDNPASRLYTFFQQFQGTTGAVGGPNQPVARVLGTMWHLEWPARRAQIARIAADIVDLPQEIVEAVEAAPENDYLVKSEILAPASSWTAAAVAVLEFNSAAIGVLTNVTSDTQNNLRYCARMLAGTTRLPVLPIDKMADLMAEANSFLEDVLATEMSADLKAFLVTQLESIREALLRARTGGGEVLLDGYTVVASRTYRRRNRGDAVAAEAPGAWNRFRLLVHEFGILAALAADLTGGPANVVTLTDAINDKPVVYEQITPAPEDDLGRELDSAARPAIESGAAAG